MHADDATFHAPMQVEELKASRARKLRARARYEEYVKQRNAEKAGSSDGTGASAAASGAGASAGAATDYARWDLWCPSDEDDELFNGLAPSNPGFRAMERDINERHKRCEGVATRRRRLAETR
jgi:hypothetical protein